MGVRCAMRDVPLPIPTAGGSSRHPEAPITAGSSNASDAAGCQVQAGTLYGRVTAIVFQEVEMAGRQRFQVRMLLSSLLWLRKL